MRKLAVATVLIASFLLLLVPAAHAAVLPASLTTAPVVVRVEGPTRIDTAVEASKLAFTSADTFVLCTAWNWPDALGGSALAGAHGGPLLLTDAGTLSPQVVAEATRLNARNAIVIGSTAAVSAEVERALKALSVNGHTLSVTRIGGVDRFETCAMVASATVDEIRRRGGTYDGTAFFSTGRNFPDALAAAPVAAKKGWPLLLVEPAALPAATRDAISRLHVTRGIILGSDKAVGSAVATALAGVLPAPPTRLEGPDRYVTGLEIARFGVSNGLRWDGVAFATGENFPDALAGGVMQAKLGSVVLLTPTAYLRQPVFDELVAQRAVVNTVRYLGSTSAVRQFARDGVYAALTGGVYLPPNWMTFPVAGPCSYSNDFGDPRGGGTRTHEGNDILAAWRTPCVAVLSGTVTARTSTLGGNTIYLDADNGWRFYYAHLDNWIPGLRPGGPSLRVSQGQVIGYVGNTGNASGGPFHLHFQMWTPGGTLVNPYTYLQGMLR